MNFSASSQELIKSFDGPFFRAGLGLFLVSSVGNFVRSGFSYLCQKAKAYFILTVELDSKDAAYSWVLMWLSQNKSVQKSNRYSLISEYQDDDSLFAEKVPKYFFVPSLGDHWISWKQKWLFVDRVRDTNATDMTNGGFFESIKLSIIGSDRSYFDTLFSEARRHYYEKETNLISIYRNHGNQWGKKQSKIPRTIDSVILPEETKQSILHDTQLFKDSAKWYREMSIPYRRGYLLYGPPGTGKTSFIFALAGKMKLSICSLSLSDPDLRDEDITDLFNTSIPGAILLIEDLDVCLRESNPNIKFSLSGLLNALDGISAQEGKLVFITTNFPEKIDPRLLRPGRVDFKAEFGLANSAQISALFLRFYKETSPERARLFAGKIPPHTLSMAAIQGHLLKFRDSAQDAIQNVTTLLQEQRSSTSLE